MQNVERLSITLPIDMASMIRAKVKAGSYASNSEVIREAVRAWQEQEQLRFRYLATISVRSAASDSDLSPMPSEEAKLIEGQD